MQEKGKKKREKRGLRSAPTTNFLASGTPLRELATLPQDPLAGFREK